MSQSVLNDVTKQGVRIHACKVRMLTICIVNGCAGVYLYIVCAKQTK